MPRRCAYGCDPSDVPMHRFPNSSKFPDRFRSWVTLAGGKLESISDYEYYENKRACDIHFTDKDKNRNKRLNIEAIPSLYLPGSTASPNVSGISAIQHIATSQLAEESDATPKVTEQPAKQHLRDDATAQESEGAISSALSSVEHVLLEHNYFMNRKQRSKVDKGTSRKRTYIVRPLCTKIRRLRTEIARLRKKGRVFKDRLRNAEMVSENAEFLCLSKNMTKPAQLFVQMQLQASKKAKGRRFSLEEKVLALSLFKKSPKSYGLLSNYFTLPSSKTMKRLLSKIKITPGINKVIFDKLKNTVLKWPVTDRLCRLIFDEMSLSPQVFYNTSKDLLDGFASNRGNQFADHALVFMVKGIKLNFKQPIAYYFTSGLKKTELKEIIKLVIKEAQDAGLIIINTVCDQSTVNVGAINDLISQTKKMYFQRGKEWRNDVIRINGQNIIPIYDAPHLIKGLRNNLLTKDMVYTIGNEERLVKWKYYQKLFAADRSYGELRLLYKLTEEHVNPEKINKMRVKLATQIFSHSVAVATEHLTARGDLPIECRNLVEITLLLDKLFDSLNVNTFHIPNGKEYKGPIKRCSPHHQLWLNCKNIIKTIKFKYVKKIGSKVMLTETTVPSVQNLIKTIEGIEAIWKTLSVKYGFDTFLTRNLNQDPVENFFGNIRSYGARNIAPNTLGFEGAFKALLLNNYNSPHSSRANCEEDLNKCLHTLDFFITEQHKDSSDITKEFQINCNEELFVERNEADAGQRNYVCGWVLMKCLKNVVKSCQICRQNLIGKDDENINNAYIKAKEYKNKKWLCYPNKEIEKCFNDIQNLTTSFLKKEISKDNIKKSIVALSDLLVEFPFQCPIHKDELKQYFCNVTINLLVCSWCRSVNKILAGKITYDGDDETKNAAKMYYKKHKYRNKK